METISVQDAIKAMGGDPSGVEAKPMTVDEAVETVKGIERKGD